MTPQIHRALPHAALRERLVSRVREGFGAAGEPAGWDPAALADAHAHDLGRGLLDSVALALHVLWTYQEAWADEGFLRTARLDGSVARLLAAIGYEPSPGLAGVGLQHFRAKPGTDAVLPAGFGVRSRPLPSGDAATFETLHPLRLDPLLNELGAWLPPSEPVSQTTSGVASAQKIPPGSMSAADAIGRALDGERAGSIKARDANKLRARMRRLADVMASLRDKGFDGCTDILDAMCDELCEAQEAAAAAAGAPTTQIGPLSESQELVARMLKRLGKAQKDAITALEEALAPFPGEDATAYGKRIAAIARFLDAFVAGLIQESRDQIVLLAGPEGLRRIDRSLGDRTPPKFGVAPPGTDALFLVRRTDGAMMSGTLSVRPGDWFVIGEDVERLDPAGNPRKERRWTEAVRVLRVEEATPPEVNGPLTKIVFTPPLARRYRLDEVAIAGNVAVISHGRTMEHHVVARPGLRSVDLPDTPVTWLRDPAARRGRRPEVKVTVGGRDWTRVDEIRGYESGDAVYAVEGRAGGVARLRFGDGVEGAAPQKGADIAVRYRVGASAEANVAALLVDAMASASPAVERTFNPLPIEGGVDAEEADTARTRGPLVVAARDRAASLRDLRALTLVYPGVHRAKVSRDPTAPRAVRIVVSGRDGVGLPPSDRRALEAFLRVRVPPGVRVSVLDRASVGARVEARLFLADASDPVSVVRRVRVALGVEREEGLPWGLLDPDRVELGQDLRLSDVYGALASVPEVASAVVVALHRSAAPPTLHDRVIAHDDELIAWSAPTGEQAVSLAWSPAVDR